MKKLSFIVALLCASMLSFAQKDVNFALASNGSTATASSEKRAASLAIDGIENGDSRWESNSTDDETWTLNMGQSRTFNTIRILWEGAYCKEFTISYSSDGTNWTLWHNETELASPGWQTIYKTTNVSAQYIQYHGTKRATGYGQSFYEFQVMLADAPKENIAKNKTIVASSTGYNDVNRVVDGNSGTEWQGSATNGTSDDEVERTFDAWFVVDLGSFYSIDQVNISFEGACSQAYHLDFSVDNSNWSVGYNYVGSAGVNGHTDQLKSLDNNTKVRYVRFWSTKAATQWGMKVFEIEVYGSEWVDSGDTEKPVMVSASVDSKTWNSVVLAVSATDNKEVVKYHVVDAAKSIDVKLAPAAGKITVSGLTAETSYNLTVTAIDGANNESDNNKVVAVTTEVHVFVPTTAAPAPTWPAKQVKSLYSDAYEFAPASLTGYCQNWWQEPTMTEEAIGENHYLHYDLYREGMIGAQFASISVATMEKIHIDIWASAAGSVTFRPITTGGPNTPKTLTLEAMKWNSFDIDMTDFAGHNWTALYQFAIEQYQAGGLVGEHISVDNIYFYRTTEFIDNEKPTDLTAAWSVINYFGATITANAKDNSGAVMYIVKNGDAIVGSGGGASGVNATIDVTGLLPNTSYNLSVIAQDEANNAADPVVVEIKTKEAPAAAPKPDFTGKKAVPVFCDGLADNPEINIGGWGQTTVAQFGQIADGDMVCHGSNFNYLGWELTPAVNASGMEYVHVDFYATDMTSIQLTPISPGHEGVYQVTLTPNAWTSVDVPLSTYAAKEIAWDNIFQFKFMEANPGGKELFIDNVYFYKEDDGTGVENIEDSASRSQKVIENGQLIIIKNGLRYNVAGQRIQ